MAEEVKELLVKVSATTELLRSNLIAAEREIAKFENTTNGVTQRVERNFKQVNQSSGQVRAGMQQLSFQLNDVATMFALGAKPMQIFASQAGQIIQSVQVMSGGTSKLAAFLGGPWGAALTTAAVVLSPFIGKLLDAKTAAEEMGDAAADAMAKLNASLASGQSLTGQAADAATKRLINNMGALAQANRGIQETVQAINSLQGRAGSSQTTAALSNRLEQLKLQRSAAQAEVEGAREQLNQVRSATQIQAMQAAAQTRINAARASGSSRTSSSRVSRASTADISNPITAEVAFRAEMSKITDQIGQDLAKVRDSDYEAQIELINRKADYEFEARREAIERLRQVEERQIDFMASMYEDAFRGGTAAIWENFESIGLAVISRVLAQFTIAKVTGKGNFDLGSAFSTALTGILGFADGGRPPVGRVSVVGERGPELFVPDGAGTVIPNHALGGGGMSMTINAPGATAETVAMIRRELANAAPSIVAAASGNTIRALNRKSL